MCLDDGLLLFLFFFFLCVFLFVDSRIGRLEHDCAQLRALRLQSASPSIEAEHFTTAIPVQKLCDAAWSSRSANPQRKCRIVGAVCERIGSHGAEFRHSGRPGPDIEDADGVLRDAQGMKCASWRGSDSGRLTGFDDVGPDTKCEKEDLPVDAVHWKIRKGAHRDAARGAEAEP